MPTQVPSIEDFTALILQIEALKTKVDSLTPTQLSEEVKAAAIVLLEWMLQEVNKP